MFSKIETLPEWLAGMDEKNTGTLWQVVKAYRANLRQGTAAVKSRAMVCSTGKKPFKQKGMGRARRGTFVAPNHVGGGVAHGPVPRDYRQPIPVKMAKTALGIILAKRIQEGTVYVGETVAKKTKEAYAEIFGSKITDGKGRTVVCLDSDDAETMQSLVLAYRNLPNIVVKSASQLNAFDIAMCRTLVLSKGAVQKLEARFAHEKLRTSQSVSV